MSKVLNTSTIVLFVVCALSVFCLTRAQLALKSIDTKIKMDGNVPNIHFEAIEKSIGTSEAYWRIRAKSNMSHGCYDNAMAYIRKARLYSSAPELLGMETECLRQTGQTDAGMQLIDTLSNMLPHVLRLKLILMRYNASCGKRAEALRYAADIISTDAKYDTSETRAIIQEARKYKQIYER